jgi:hypothetical protein
MDEDRLAAACDHLAHGPFHRFADPLDPGLPRVAAGCYTVWDDDGRFVYAGMAGRALTADRILVAGSDPARKVTGLRDRLGAHRNGRRPGDQFSVFVFDRFVLAALIPEHIASASAGTRRLDDDVRDYIRGRLSYRWWETADGADAFTLETVLVTVGLDGALPFLNPRKVEEP